MDKWKLRICGILLSVVSSTFCLDVSIAQSTYSVARGDSVNITCNFRPKNEVNRLIIISWTADRDESFDDEGISFGTYYSDDNHRDIDPMYQGKAEIESDVGARVSKLILKQVTLRESRHIRCRVQIPGDDKGQTSATTSLVVLVAPSNPVCKIKGTAEYGYNISLTCASDEGSPIPTYKWQSYDVKNVPRSFPPKTTESDGVLSLFNVSIETSGYYICTATNMIRSASCNLTVAVMPSSMNISAAAGIIGGCIAGIAVLVLIIYCCCRKKDKPEEFYMRPPVIELTDVSEKENSEEGPGDLRKASIEGSIDQREKNELKVEKTSNFHGLEDGDRNSNRRFEYDDTQDRTADRQEDDRCERDDRKRPDDCKDRYDHQDRYEDHRDRSDDRQNHRDQNRYDDRRDRCDNRQDRYDDRRDRYDDRRDRYDDRRDHYYDREDDRRDRYYDREDDRRDRYYDREDDRRDHYGDRYDDRRNRYGERQDLHEDHRYQDRYDDHRDRYNDRQDRQDDRRDR